MFKVPVRHKRSISQELKKFVPLINSLQARGKSSTEEDARILLNDIFHCALGYDKYNELKTEMRDRNGRIDYVVKLNEGPNRNKNDKFDFVVEAKAAYVELNQHTVNQALTYCLTSNVDYFILTNAVKWQLYRVKRQGKQPTALLIHEVNLGTSNDFDSLAEEFYLFSKASYLNEDWKDVTNVIKATKTEDVVAVLLSDKVVRTVTRELCGYHGVKISEDTVRDIIENQIIKSAVSDVNKKLLKKLNEKPVRKEQVACAESEKDIVVQLEGGDSVLAEEESNAETGSDEAA